MQFCLFSKKKKTKTHINKHVYNFVLFFNQALCCVCNLFKKESVLTGMCDTGNTSTSTPYCTCGVPINSPVCSAGGGGGMMPSAAAEAVACICRVLVLLFLSWEHTRGASGMVQ